MKIALGAALVCALSLLGSAATAATPSTSIAKLNAQRIANGLPGGITLNSNWSSQCHQHNLYENQNQTLTHPEDKSKPGYTDTGNWAGTHAVLAEGISWNGGNPWEYAPIHLTQLLGPGLSTTGVDDWNDWVCAITFPGYQRKVPATNQVYTYPGNGKTIYPSMVATELPFVPGQFVGLPEGTRTGPYLYVYVWGPWVNEFGKTRITAAKLTGPDGSIPLKTVDNTTHTLGPYLPQGSGMLIPVKPLEPSAAYHAYVTMSDGTQKLSYDWAFKTAATEPDQNAGAKKNSISLRYSILGTQLQVTVTSIASNPTMTLQPPTGAIVNVPFTKSGDSWTSPSVDFVSGTRMCVQSGGGKTGYPVVQSCKTL